MDFTLNEEQSLLQASVRRFVEKSYGFEVWRAIVQQHAGFSRDHWKAFAEMGWLGVALPEDVGGYGGSAVEEAIVLEELGRGLVLEPYLTVAVLAAQVIERGATAQQRQAWLPSLVSGTSRMLLAHGESDARGRVAWVETRATRAAGGNWILRGRKSLVLGGPVADRFFVSARTAGGAEHESGITLFVLDGNAPGLSRRDYRLIDGRLASDLVLDGVAVGPASVLGREGDAFSALDHAHSRAITGLCAEAVGAMERAVWMTRDYLTTRIQFGVPIGSFQALQHRMADMVIETEQSRAMVHRALAFLDHPDAITRRRAVSAAKAQVGRSGKFVGGQGIQLHGGIGMTDECGIGHYFKRLCVADVLFGDVNDHLAELARGYRSRRSEQTVAETEVTA